MSYIDPHNVTSPKHSVSDLQPIYDGGEDSFSVALLKWDGNPCIGIRWHDVSPKPGNPQSRGLPTWFIMPKEFDLPILQTLQVSGMIGGGTIDRNKAEELIKSIIDDKLDNTPSTSKIIVNETLLKDFIIEVITNLKAEGKI